MATSFPGPWQKRGLLSGWRGLGRFWMAILTAAALTAAVIQALGPPLQPMPPQSGPVAHADPLPVPHASPAPHTSTPSHQATESPVEERRPGRTIPGPVAAPDPALMEPYPGDPKRRLPRIAVDGRAPMDAYAAGFDSSNLRPKVALLIAGIGMSQADSLAAIKNLPGGVTLAVSPYAGDIANLLDVARLNEHEFLLSLPMEPQSFPLNDPDNRFALMTSLSPADNMERLRSLLARQAGYAGVTNAFGPMRGERLSGMESQFGAVLQDVANRGLMFVDARTGQPPLPYVWNRSADIVLDDGAFDAATLDQRLDTLTHLALDKGSALGLVLLPRPVTLDRAAAWTNGLASKGVALAPVSALMLPAAKQEPER